MKWGIVILLLLGLVAAGSAAVLMGTLSVRPRAGEKEPQEIEIVMAKRFMPASTVIKRDDIETEIVARDEVPQGKLVSPVQIVGRVLAWQVMEGQVLTESCLVPEGTPSILASQIPAGWRVFTVPITSRARPDNILLYPGCVVDVLVEYKLGRNSKGSALSQTMLRGLKVLAISGDSVVANPDEGEGTDKRNSRKTGTVVSLLVTPRQAEALQLAVENGQITMSLRNPLDDKAFAQEPSVLNTSTLLSGGTTITSTVSPESSDGYGVFGEKQWFDANDPGRITPDNPMQDNIFNRPERITPQMKQRWQVEMILGREKKFAEFENPEKEAEKTAQEK